MKSALFPYSYLHSKKEAYIIYTQTLSTHQALEAQAFSKHQALEAQIQDITKQLQVLPAGSLSCTSNGKHYKWYHCHDNEVTYIPRNQKAFAEQLALKKYLCSLLDDLSHERRALQFYLDHHRPHSLAEKVLTHPEFSKLLSLSFTPLSQELADWQNADYPGNPNYPEHLIHKSFSGKLVRSKSESIIDMLLYLHKIPYRYECALQLGDAHIYPDFTIRHPTTGALYYWEHFGQMDNPTYAQGTFSKLQLYTAHGIIPSIHLITTYETKTTPLTPEAVKKIIAFYFEN